MNPSSPPALVLGEALIDAVVDAAGSRLTPGGSPMNVAVGLARLGVPVTLATQFGDDEYGRLIAAHLAKDHVTVDRADGRTSVARAELNADGSARYDFDIEWDRDAPVTATVPAVAHTGSIGAFLQPGNRAAADLFRQLPPSTIRSFDPNIRPALLDREAALEQFHLLVGRAHVVKLSDEDAEWIHPGVDPDGVLDRLLDAGVRLAAITRGAAGSVIASAAGRVEVPAPSVDVADTIGAGDAYMSGLLFALLRGDGLRRVRDAKVDATTLARVGAVAAASAAVAVSRPGANPPSPGELLAATEEPASDPRIA
ncbi:carbohydrate kinase [Curtobacterium sp. MCBD17_034]|uniref:carbohydrate kinase family protein n=1 Tax=unclassified Curtobacterium TaxID=257496 RepID=UPI000DA9CD8D|nr:MULTISPECIES: carbohydrate kinase [unclassified Curtobacterium]PZF60341.1 carbohydrate kinase [Curtobacterium sp. MCBD17_034]PZM35026.1 carbohydrate kinase [Curtobacterium sp. MCBD17_031]